MKQRKQDDLNDIIASENLKADETDKFMANTFPLRSKNKKYKRNTDLLHTLRNYLSGKVR